MKYALLIIVIVASLLVLDYSSLLWEGFIAPKRQDVRRKVFEKTKSYF
jgi:hypothetical protein